VAHNLGFNNGQQMASAKLTGLITAFSASSRNFDLNGEARTARTKQSGPIIPPT
jgi:hypothetical protein